MNIVENALLELRSWSNPQTPDNLPAFILARHILGVVPIDSTVDITPFIDEFLELATEDDMVDGVGDVIDEWGFDSMVREAMPKVKSPAGREMEHLVDRALSLPIPDDLASIEDPDGLLLARVCRVLQDDAGKKPFYLSQTNAGVLIGKKRAAGGRKLKALQAKNYIALIKKGYPGIASYYTCYAIHISL